VSDGDAKRSMEAIRTSWRITDPVITCSKCKGNFRADNMIRKLFQKKSQTINQMKKLLNLIQCIT